MRASRAILAGLGALTIASAVAATATPAFADASVIRAEAQDLIIGADGAPGKATTISVYEFGPLTNPKVTIDFTGIDGIATPTFLDPASGCSLTGSVATCDLPDVTDPNAGASDIEIPVKLVPAAGAHNGVTGSFTMTSTADGVATVTESATVTVADGPDLGLPKGDNSLTAKPGDALSEPVMVSNSGSQAADGVLFLFAFSHGFQPDYFDNCLYADWPDDDGTLALCEIDQSLAPGQTWTINPAIIGHVPADSADTARVDLVVDVANASSVSSELANNAFGLAKSRAHFIKRASGKLLTPSSSANSAGDIDFGDNFETWTWTIKTSYDMVANGAKVIGTPGDVVKVKLGETNNGPASIDFWSVHDIAAVIEIAIPEWADAVAVPSNCFGQAKPESQILDSKPGYRYYLCSGSSYVFPAHSSFSVTLSLKIKASSGADGSVSMPHGDAYGVDDNNHANDVAAITLGAPDEGGLPVTGSKTGIIAVAGAILVLAGGVLLFLGRRRRRATVAS